MMLHNHLELTQGRGAVGALPGTCLKTAGVRQSALGGKVTRKHDDLQEIAYETFGLASPQRGGETAVVCWLQTKSVVRREFGSARG